MLVSIEDKWSYKEVPYHVPPNPNALTIPLGGFAIGKAPFGQEGDYDPLVSVNTVWNTAKSFWIEKQITLEGFRPIIISGLLKQGAIVFFDGVYVAGYNINNFPAVDVLDYVFVIPESIATTGSHTISVYCMCTNAPNPEQTSYITLEIYYMHLMISSQSKAPLKESLEWLTDVIDSKNGNEETISTRISARQSFSHNYPSTDETIRKYFNISYSNSANKWFIPLWQEQVSFDFILAGSFSIAVDTTVSDYRNSSFALLWSDKDNWQILGISTITDSLINLTGETESFGKCILMPLRIGHVIKNISRKTNSYNADYSIEYLIKDNLELPSVSNPPVFMGDDLYFLEGLMLGDNITDNIIQKVETTDYKTGVVEYKTTWKNPKISRQYNIIVNTKEEVREYKNWAYRRKGKFRVFWSPSQDSDFKNKSIGLVESIVLVSSDYYMETGSLKKNIAIEERNGTWHIKTIINVIRVDKYTIQIYLDSPLNVEANEIKKISYLTLKRIETDRITFNWIGAMAVKISVKLLEISL